jgi:hypothetical protein
MPDYRITTGLPQLPAGQKDASFNLVLPLYQAMNSLAQSLSVVGGLVDYSQAELADRSQWASISSQNHNKIFALATTDMLFGQIVNLVLSGGKISMQLADATDDTKPAHGIVNQPQGILTGEYGEVVLSQGYVQGISGTTFGATYYLSAVGLVQTIRPSAVGTIIQAVGTGFGTAGFYLNISSLFIKN